MDVTYVGEAEDFAVEPVADDYLLLVCDAVVVAEALEKLVLDLADVEVVGDLAEEELARLAANAGCEGRGVGFGTGEVFNALREI